jgi:hypothetical protein
VIEPEKKSLVVPDVVCREMSPAIETLDRPLIIWLRPAWSVDLFASVPSTLGETLWLTRRLSVVFFKIR